MTSDSTPAPTTTLYQITLITDDGRIFGTVTDATATTSYAHVCDEVLELSDSPEPDTPAMHVDTFTRLLVIDGDALYVKTAA